MSAGLPGLGLGGLFFILSALLAPVVELVRTARGQSSAAAWRGVARQFAIAATMIVAVDLALRAVLGLASLAGLAEAPDAGLTVLPLAPIGITMALLAAVLAGAKGLQLAMRVREQGMPRIAISRTPASRRQLAVGAAVVAGWFALLALGASELSPLSAAGGDSDRVPAPVLGLEDYGPGEPARRHAASSVPPLGDVAAADLPGEPVGPNGDDAPLEQGSDDSGAASPPAESGDRGDGQGGSPDPGPAPSETQPPSEAPAPAPETGSPAGPSPEADSPPDSTPAPEPGPPIDAGPPSHSGAPPGAGPPPWAGPGSARSR